MRGDVIPCKVIQVLFFVLLPSFLRLLQVDAFLFTVVSALTCLVIQIIPLKVSQTCTTMLATTVLNILNTQHY